MLQHQQCTKDISNTSWLSSDTLLIKHMRMEAVIQVGNWRNWKQNCKGVLEQAMSEHPCCTQADLPWLQGAGGSDVSLLKVLKKQDTWLVVFAFSIYDINNSCQRIYFLAYWKQIRSIQKVFSPETMKNVKWDIKFLYSLI